MVSISAGVWRTPGLSVKAVPDVELIVGSLSPRTDGEARSEEERRARETRGCIREALAANASVSGSAGDEERGVGQETSKSSARTRCSTLACAERTHHNPKTRATYSSPCRVRRAAELSRVREG